MQGTKKEGRAFFSRIDFNAPVILSMTLLSLALLGLNALLGHALDRVFGAYFTRYGDLWMYLRLFTHAFMHQNMAHYAGNFMMILAIGPMVEEKYGSTRLLIMILATSFITGLFHIIFSHGTLLMGASGIVFMLILLASFANMREGKLPLTVILVAVLYIGNEIVSGIGASDQVSHISHILGGLCGAGFGFLYGRRAQTKA